MDRARQANRVENVELLSKPLSILPVRNLKMMMAIVVVVNCHPDVL